MAWAKDSARKEIDSRSFFDEDRNPVKTVEEATYIETWFTDGSQEFAVRTEEISKDAPESLKPRTRSREKERKEDG